MDSTIVCGSIIENDGKILMVKESKDIAYGQWNIPTGKVEKDEKLTHCAKREVLEETGVKTDIKSLIGVYTKPSQTSDIVTAFIFEGQNISNTSLDPREGEILEADWIDKNEISTYSLRSSHILKALEHYEDENHRIRTDMLTKLDEI
jgi:ADP-ribose pyrophosphatase YjhB (NUDIX family)